MPDNVHVVENVEEPSKLQLSSGPMFTQEQFDRLLALISFDPSSGNLSSSFISSCYVKHNVSIPVSANFYSCLLDSGANDHVCSSHASFKSFYKNKPNNVQLPNDSCVSVEIASTISLTPNITLFNELFLPNFSLHLIYVFKLCHHSNCIVFFFWFSMFDSGLNVQENDRFG